MTSNADMKQTQLYVLTELKHDIETASRYMLVLCVTASLELRSCCMYIHHEGTSTEVSLWGHLSRCTRCGSCFRQAVDKMKAVKPRVHCGSLTAFAHWREVQVQNTTQSYALYTSTDHCSSVFGRRPVHTVDCSSVAVNITVLIPSDRFSISLSFVSNILTIMHNSIQQNRHKRPSRSKDTSKHCTAAMLVPHTNIACSGTSSKFATHTYMYKATTSKRPHTRSCPFALLLFII